MAQVAKTDSASYLSNSQCSCSKMGGGGKRTPPPQTSQAGYLKEAATNNKNTCLKQDRKWRWRGDSGVESPRTLADDLGLDSS